MLRVINENCKDYLDTCNFAQMSSFEKQMSNGIVHDESISPTNSYKSGLSLRNTVNIFPYSTMTKHSPKGISSGTDFQ